MFSVPIKNLNCETLTGSLVTVTKKNVQKLYKLYTNIIQKTKFVYILYSYSDCTNLNFVIMNGQEMNECTRNKHQISTYTQKM